MESLPPVSPFPMGFSPSGSSFTDGILSLQFLLSPWDSLPPSRPCPGAVGALPVLPSPFQSFTGPSSHSAGSAPLPAPRECSIGNVRPSEVTGAGSAPRRAVTFPLRAGQTISTSIPNFLLFPVLSQGFNSSGGWSIPVSPTLMFQARLAAGAGLRLDFKHKSHLTTRLGFFLSFSKPGFIPAHLCWMDKNPGGSAAPFPESSLAVSLRLREPQGFGGGFLNLVLVRISPNPSGSGWRENPLESREMSADTKDPPGASRVIKQIKSSQEEPRDGV